MGLSVGNTGQRNGRRRRGRGAHGLMSEINVTPFVDVMLVLLIIFMVTAPMLVNGVPVKLPQSAAGALETDKTPLSVSLTEDGRIAINKDYYSREELVSKLRAIGEGSPEGFGQRVVMRAAADAPVGEMVGVLALVKKAGFTDVAIASVAEQGR